MLTGLTPPSISSKYAKPHRMGHCSSDMQFKLHHVRRHRQQMSALSMHQLPCRLTPDHACKGHPKCAGRLLTSSMDEGSGDRGSRAGRGGCHAGHG